jgi:hypothetical protein
LECNSEFGPDVTGYATAEDNCNEFEVTYADSDITGSCPASFVRTWTATDACGNSASCNQTISIDDTIAPELVNEIPSEITVECDEDVPSFVPVWSDNCDAELTLTADSDITAPGCVQTINRSWTATDDCGNFTTISQVVTIIDTTAPVFGQYAAELTFDCDEDIVYQDPSATDNCNQVTIECVNGEINTGNCPLAYSYTRTCTAIDLCGNSSSVTQVINVLDNSAPVITGEVEIDLPCDNYEVVAIQAYDNCGDVTVEFVDSQVSGGCVGRIIREYTATDVCGNVSTFEQIITLTDEVAPEWLLFPDDVTVECDNIPGIDVDVEYSDNCTGVILSYNGEEIVAGDCPQSYTLRRTWTITDFCGNSTPRTWTINIKDSTAPIFDEVAGDVTVECDEVLPAPYATAYDNCGSVSIDVSDVTLPGQCANGYTLVRTYTATDDCGNNATATQIITVIDTTDPVFGQLPESITIACDDVVPAPAEVTATDNCQGDVDVQFSEEIDGDGCYVVISRTWTAEDACGNSVEYQQNITIVDNIAPVFENFPYFVQLSCELVDDYTISASDNCGQVTITFNDNFLSGGCYETISRTWTATDECGNSTSAEQLISVTDETAPTIIGVGDDYTLDCSDVPSAPQVSATDNCGEPQLTFNEEIIPGQCAGNYTIVWTWTATDFCDNVSSEQQVITVTDTQAPEFVEVPADLNLACGEDVPSPAQVSAIDNCSGVSVDLTENVVPGNCEGSYTIVRTWTASDACGNTADAQQIINVGDDAAPEFVQVPQNASYECNEIVALEWPVAEDLCGVVSLDYSDATLPGECASEYTIERTFVATDACGNASYYTQIIEVSDNTAPVLSETPSDLVIDCQASLPQAPSITATDNCDAEVEVVLTEEYFGDNLPQGAQGLCNLTTPVAMSPDWAVALFNLPNGDELYETVNVDFAVYSGDENGLQAHLSGSVVSKTNPDAGWNVDVWFDQGVDWETWSNRPWANSYKDDANFAGDNYLDWTYYIMVSGQATLTGWGDYEGSLLSLSHAPSNKYYAYQVGYGANNFNQEFGHGGWFYADGILRENGVDQLVDISGDFAFDAACCPQGGVTRTWTATDCAGNVTSVSQTITFEDLGGDENPEEANFGTCMGDLNTDGVRNVYDLLDMLAGFGCMTGNCDNDLDGDGNSAVGDLLLFLTVLGSPCN